MSCKGIVCRPKTCSFTRYTLGHGHYTSAPHIAAIVIHPIVGIGLEAYEGFINSPLTSFDEGSINPKSVHFIVTETASIQYANIGSTTFGLDYFKNPTWPGLNDLYPVTDVNGPFIHIGFIDDCNYEGNLLRLLCCIVDNLGYAPELVASSDLQSDRPEYSINPTLYSQYNDCAYINNLPDPINIFDLEERVIELEKCCIDNKTQILLLKQRMSVAEYKVSNHEVRITNLENQIININEQVSQIPAILAQLQILSEQVQFILTNCCPISPENECIQYQLNPGNQMLITANQPVHLNLPLKIGDSEPPKVITGPLWKADLSGDCDWSIEANVRFRLRSWCSGRSAKLTLSICGVLYAIGEYEIPSTGPQVVTLSGNFLLPAPGCNNVFLYVSHNDDSPQIVEFANFKACSLC